MSGRASAIAWVLSVLPLAAPLGSQLGGDVSRSALVLLPWLALAGLPGAAARAGDAPGAGGTRPALGSLIVLPLALLAAPLALGIHLDLGRGFQAAQLVRTMVPALVMTALLGAASARSSGGAAQAAYGVIWLALVAAVPVAAAVFASSGGAGGGGGRVLEQVASASPLDWLARRAAGGETALWRPAALSVGLFAASFRATPGGGGGA